MWHKGSRLNAVDSMQCHWMQWIPCSMVKSIPIERSVFHEAWLNGSRLNAVDYMQHGSNHTDWMQWTPCSVIECSGFHAPWKMEPYWMQWILCSMIECSGFYAAWPKASRLNAVDSMQRHWMQKIQCILAQWIPIVSSGVHAVRPNASRTNAVDFMQHGQNHPDWMQWIPCIVIECGLIHAAW